MFRRTLRALGAALLLFHLSGCADDDETTEATATSQPWVGDLAQGLGDVPTLTAPKQNFVSAAYLELGPNWVDVSADAVVADRGRYSEIRESATGECDLVSQKFEITDIILLASNRTFQSCGNYASGFFKEKLVALDGGADFFPLKVGNQMVARFNMVDQAGGSVAASSPVTFRVTQVTNGLRLWNATIPGRIFVIQENNGSSVSDYLWSEYLSAVVYSVSRDTSGVVDQRRELLAVFGSQPVKAKDKTQIDLLQHDPVVADFTFPDLKALLAHTKQRSDVGRSLARKNREVQAQERAQQQAQEKADREDRDNQEAFLGALGELGNGENPQQVQLDYDLQRLHQEGNESESGSDPKPDQSVGLDQSSGADFARQRELRPASKARKQ